MNRLKGLKNLLQDAIDKGSTAIQEVHQEIADRPFNVLERLAPLKAPVQTVRNIHDTVLRVSYESVRGLNRVAADAADKLIDVATNRSETDETRPAADTEPKGAEPKGAEAKSSEPKRTASEDTVQANRAAPKATNQEGRAH